MAYLARYQPWNRPQDFFSEVSKLFDQSVANDASAAASGVVAEWTPAVDIEEHADKFVLFADVPGVDPASIEVTLDKCSLVLSGVRAEATEQKGVERRRVERSHGRFQRRFSLPDSVDAESVTANDRHGVLEVVIPKRPQVQPRHITVNGTATA